MDIEKSSFQKLIDDLLQKEKSARMNNQTDESCRLLKQIVQLAYDMKEYEQLFE